MISKNKRSSNSRRRRCSLATVSSLAGMLLAMGCSHQGGSVGADTANIRAVAVATVQRGSLARTLDVAAEFRPFQEVDLLAKEAGYVKQINVDVGDHVHKGQLLAVLEVPELQDEVNQANAELKRSEDEITRAQADQRRAQAAYEVAHVTYTRLATVMKSRPELIAQQDVDDATGKDQQAQAQVDTAKAALASARQQLEVARAKLQKTQTLLAYAEIRAPFDGVITKRYADKGTMLAAGTSSEKQAIPLVQLSQNGLLRLTIPVPESAVSLIHTGSIATIHVPELNRDISGKVSRFAGMVTTDTRTMDTEIDVPNPRFELTPGMYANVSLVLDQQSNALIVPIEAVVSVGEKATALVVSTSGQLEERQVKVGIETATRVQILSGLQENEFVVLGSRSQLRIGEKVQPKQAQSTDQGSH